MVEVTVEDRATLESWIRATTTEQRLVLRARIILALARGRTNREVAEELSIRPATVSKWRTRFATKGIGGLADAPRSGKPPTYTEEAERRVLSQLDEDPPPGYARWNGPLLAQVLTDVSETQVWRILRRHGISLERRRSWCVSTDPEFDRKAADVVGLYLDPPENAVVLCVDEKPHTQALERAHGWLVLPDGRSLKGFSSRYRRHGTTTLFAALEVATGLHQTGGHLQSREEGGGAVPAVAGRETLEGAAVRQDEPPLGPLQGLDVGLLVHAEDHGVLRRVQVETHHVRRLAVELGVGAHAPAAPALERDPVAAQDAPDLRLGDVGENLG